MPIQPPKLSLFMPLRGRITGFTGEFGPGNTFTYNGTIVGITSPENTVILLGGIGKTVFAQPDTDGEFSITVTVPPGSSGGIWAQGYMPIGKFGMVPVSGLSRNFAR